MYKLSLFVLISLLLFAFNCQAIQLDDFTISATFYPDKLPEIVNHGWLVSDQEWLSLSVGFTINISQGLYTKFDTETFIFATNGYRFAPSSTKFIYELGYSFEKIHIKYRHFCHHYFHQFANHYNDSDKIIFEYSF